MAKGGNDIITLPAKSINATLPSRIVRKRLKRIRRNYELYLLLLPAIAYFAIFHYWPMYGLQIAFKDFNAALGIMGSPWAGLKHFTRYVESFHFWRMIGNTFWLSVYMLVVNFPAPIILALVLNELKNSRFKKLVQTVTYAPHFISTVVLVAMLTIFLNPNYGIVNTIIRLLGIGPFNLMASEKAFQSVYVFSGVWQHTGWGTVIYLAALSGIDPELHLSAMIDGASRLQRIWHINISGIVPTIVILFILNVGSLFTIGFEKVFLMQNPMNIAKSEIISTYVYKVGLLQAQYSFSAAVGMVNSVLNFILLLSTNQLSRRMGDVSLF